MRQGVRCHPGSLVRLLEHAQATAAFGFAGPGALARGLGRFAQRPHLCFGDWGRLMLVDTSVWIDFLNGHPLANAARLAQAITNGEAIVGGKVVIAAPDSIRGCSTRNPRRQTMDPGSNPG